VKRTLFLKEFLSLSLVLLRYFWRERLRFEKVVESFQSFEIVFFRKKFLSKNEL
jgi:hypothetical protein